MSRIKHIGFSQPQVAVVDPVVDGGDCRQNVLGLDHHLWRIFLLHVVGYFLLGGFVNLGFTP